MSVERNLLSEPSSDPHADRDRIDKARRDAEELFKPKPQFRSADPPAGAEASVPPAGGQLERRPRIFHIPPLVPMRAAQDETPALPKKSQRRQLEGRRDSGVIPASQFGRVRALASYGMTRAQVAELYGVSADEIERIIKQT
jgi:hypothetical protein